MKWLLILLVYLALAHGCTSATAPSGGVRVDLLGATFDREPGGSIASVPFAVRAVGTRSVFLARCGDRLMAAVDRWDDGRWVQYSGDACLAIHPMAPVELRPDSRLEAVRVIGEPGRYRLRLGVASAGGEPADWSAASAPFEVR
jgi:hypothetical protein